MWEFDGMKNIGLDLAKRIEQVIHGFLAESRGAAAAAVEEGFGLGARAPAGRTPSLRRKAPAERRSPAQIEALREQFLQAVLREPGQTMETLASRLGEGSEVLHRYATRLRERGLIRAVGRLRAMRYFPMVKATTATAAM